MDHTSRADTPVGGGHALTLPIYSPLTLYAVNKEVDFVPQKDRRLRLRETSVTDNHWSVRGEKK